MSFGSDLGGWFMQRLIRKLTIVVLLAACAGSVGFAASPRLAAILPGSITRGAEGTLVFSGERLSGAEEILFYDTGFEVLSLEDSENSLSVRIRVAPDCRLGEHLAHVRTRSGVTEFRAFYVHALPQIDEQEPNNDPSIAQWIDINTAVTGLILDGDEDVFQFDAVAGEVIKVSWTGVHKNNTICPDFRNGITANVLKHACCPIESRATEHFAREG